ncbi:MAG: DUF2442 domain-containing protein [Hyphomicrobiaceae bacterium]|nr:DUF2442 domain-containing protein [Hyphomicrobiaceae bacterium]
MLNKVTEITVIAPYSLGVRFSDGTSGTHDCASIVQEPGPMFEPLRDPKYFARVFLEFGAPTWPNGFDMCPDWLHMTMTAAGELHHDAAE